MRLLLGIVFALLLATSCVRYKELLYFNEGPEFPDSTVVAPIIPDLVIQPDDLLSIQVTALDIEAAAPFNVQPPLVGGAGGGMPGTTIARPLLGYLVDKDGFIDFPVLGRLRVAGLTTTELKRYLNNKLKSYLKNPVVLIRFVNFQVSVFGEVADPGNILLPNERITVLDALSFAGDLTPFANRTNLLIIRNYNGKQYYGRINLQDRDLFSSPYYYLKQNDIIYVEPLRERTAEVTDQASRVLPYFSIVTSLTTLTLTIVSLTAIGGE